jgi:conjugative transfer signal peptidase TraF
MPFPVAHVTRLAATAALVLMAMGFACFAAGLRVNITRSIPVGVYQLTDVPVGKGEYVIFCPPQTALFDEARERGYIGAGFCPGGYGYMMKRVLATGNDRIVSTDEGLRINGSLLPLSKSLETDRAGRMLPRYGLDDYRLDPLELLLMSDVSGTSFDGRYFGPVEMRQVGEGRDPAYSDFSGSTDRWRYFPFSSLILIGFWD